MTRDTTEGLLSPSTKALTIGLVMVVTLIAFEALAVQTSLPVAEKHLGDLSIYGWTFSGFTLATLIGIACIGQLSEKLGTYRPMLIGIILFGVGLALAGSAGSMPVLVVARIIQGVGGGAINAVGYYSVARAYGDEIRPKMMATLTSAWILPSLIGPYLAGYIAQTFSWRYTFLGVLPVAIVTAFVVLPALSKVDRDRLPSTHLAHERTSNNFQSTPRPDLETVVLISPNSHQLIWSPLFLFVGVAAVLVGSSAKNLFGMAAISGVGIVVVGLALRWLLPPGVLGKSPGLLGALLVKFLTFLSFIGVEALLPYTLVAIRHKSPSYAGLVLTVSALSWAGAAWFQTRYLAKYGYRISVSLGLALIALGDLGVAALLSNSVPTEVAFLAWLIAGVGIGFAYPTTALAGIQACSQSSPASGISAMQICEVIGGALAAGLGGSALSWTTYLRDGPRPALLANDILGILAALTCSFVAFMLPSVTTSSSADANYPGVDR